MNSHTEKKKSVESRLMISFRIFGTQQFLGLANDRASPTAEDFYVLAQPSVWFSIADTTRGKTFPRDVGFFFLFPLFCVFRLRLAKNSNKKSKISSGGHVKCSFEKTPWNFSPKVQKVRKFQLVFV